MNIAEAIARQTLAEQRDILAQMESGTHRAPWVSDSQHAEAIVECRERIQSLENKVANPTLLREWWDSIPENVRHQLVNQ
jgi:hypothetical protein